MNRKNMFMSIVLFSILLLSACSNQTTAKDEPPPLNIQFPDGEEIHANLGTYEWEVKGLFSTQHILADADSPFNIAKKLEPIVVEPNTSVTLQFDDHSTPSVKAYVWEENSQGPALSIQQQQITLPSTTGRAVIEVQAEWGNSNASYTFLVEVQ